MARIAARLHAVRRKGSMIPAEARGAWRDIEARLRPYVARRVASPADVDDIVQEIFVRSAPRDSATCATASASAGGSTASPSTRSRTSRVARPAPIATRGGRRRSGGPRRRGRRGHRAPGGSRRVRRALRRSPAVAVPRSHHADGARRPHAEGGRRDARHLALGDEVSRPARSREDSRDVRRVLRDLGRLPRPRRRVRGARPGGRPGGLSRGGGVVDRKTGPNRLALLWFLEGLTTARAGS